MDSKILFCGGKGYLGYDIKHNFKLIYYDNFYLEDIWDMMIVDD